MGCQHSPYTLPGHKGTLQSCWGHCGRLTIGGHGIQLSQGATVLVEALEKVFLEDLVH